MIYMIMWNVVSGGGAARISIFHEASAMEIVINLVAVVFSPPVFFWLKCKCKFAHETDIGSCNTQQTIFPGLDGKGKAANRIPIAITFRSTFSPLYVVVLYFLARIFWKITSSEKHPLFPQHIT
jgi:hypothetical protein